MFEDYSYFSPVDCTERAKELAKLLHGCSVYNIDIIAVKFLQRGFGVVFNDHADAILHDNSYGRHKLSWETIGFPWDYDDVSVHTTEELIELLRDFKNEKPREE